MASVRFAGLLREIMELQEERKLQTTKEIFNQLPTKAPL